MTLDARPTALYRTAGERAVRAPSPAHAAWVFASRMARRKHGRDGAVQGITSCAGLYRARLVARNGYSVSVEFVVRRA